MLNKTGFAITAPMVSPISSNNRGPDILVVDTLDKGDAVKTTFDRDKKEYNWDVKVNDKDGATNELTDVNLCQTGLIEFDPTGS